ncbi:MAG: hypothetical protein ACOCUU_03600 [Nanoarchaeota archaeon]
MNSVLLLFKLIKRYHKNNSVLIRYVDETSNIIKNYLKHRKIPKRKIKNLYNILSLLRQIKKHPDETVNILKKIENEFSLFCSLPSTYLFRHPEKANEEHVGKVSEGRELSHKGVKQAKKVGEEIVQEILVVDRPTILIIEYSPFKRTYLFGQIIKRVVERGIRNFDNRVKIIFRESDLISGHLIDIPKKYFKDKNNRFPDNMKNLIEWLESHNAHDVSDFVKKWFSKTSPEKNYQVIRIGTTHLPLLVSFMVRYLKIPVNKAMNFTYADFIKECDNKFFWEERLYKHHLL